MPGFISNRPLARELIRIDDEAIAAEDDAKLGAYLAADYAFHGPGGAFGSGYWDRARPYSRRNGTVATSTLVRRRRAVARITPR